MQKSGKIKLCLLALSLVCVAAGAAACSGEEHTHTYSPTWAFDAETHWNPSECSHDTKANISEHTYTTTVIPPSITSAGYTLHICACGYSYTSDPVGSLPVETDLRFNEEGHWKVVLSGEQISVEKHEYTDTTVAPTCSTYGYTKHTCACGYWYASEPTAPVAHTYNENVWEHDANSHWHPALCCGAKAEVSGHDFTERVTAASCTEAGYTEFTCADCGYTYQGRTTPASHSYADTLMSDEYEHWRPATCGHTTEKADVADHTLVGTNNVCEVCQKAVSPRLAYELSENEEYYIVTGVGCILDESTITILDTYRGKPVREIADYAFENRNVNTVTFGANLKKIGAMAFAGTQLSSLNLPNGVEIIGASAFEGIQLSTLSLPGSVKEIGAKAFAGMDFTSLTFGASLEKIGLAAFRGCANLQTVEIVGELSLAPFVFEDCTSLTGVTCTGTGKLKEVGAQAFSNCKELLSVDLSACETVGFAAFADCGKFVPGSLQSLAVAEEYAFSGCAVQTVTLPATLQYVGDNLFNGCKQLTSLELSATTIGKSAFEGCNFLDTVTLSGVQLIGENAFKGCVALTALTLPETVIRVGENAFENTGLIITEDGVKYAANVAIGVNNGVTSVTLKAGAVGIADGAFRKIENLTSVSIGSARFIGVSAFRECGKLTAITFTESVKYIGANAFRESGLTSVTLPATVLSIGDNAFYDCMALTSATVNAKEIGRFAFSYTGVNRTLGSPVKQRPEGAKLTSLTLGSGVEIIGSNAFQYCPFASVTLPESLTTIGKYAFAQTELSSITIPAAVTRIGEYAFYGSKLGSATFADETNWKAGKKSLTLGSASQNATYLKTTYVDIDWVKE